MQQVVEPGVKPRSIWPITTGLLHFDESTTSCTLTCLGYAPHIQCLLLFCSVLLFLWHFRLGPHSFLCLFDFSFLPIPHTHAHTCTYTNTHRCIHTHFLTLANPIVINNHCAKIAWKKWKTPVWEWFPFPINESVWSMVISIIVYFYSPEFQHALLSWKGWDGSELGGGELCLSLGLPRVMSENF